MGSAQETGAATTEPNTGNPTSLCLLLNLQVSADPSPLNPKPLRLSIKPKPTGPVDYVLDLRGLPLLMSSVSHRGTKRTESFQASNSLVFSRDWGKWVIGTTIRDYRHRDPFPRSLLLILSDGPSQVRCGCDIWLWPFRGLRSLVHTTLYYRGLNHYLYYFGGSLL